MSDNYFHPQGSIPAYGTAPPLTPSMGPLPEEVSNEQPPYDPSNRPPPYAPYHGPPEYPASDAPPPHGPPRQAPQYAPSADSSSHVFMPTYATTDAQSNPYQKQIVEPTPPQKAYSSQDKSQQITIVQAATQQPQPQPQPTVIVMNNEKPQHAVDEGSVGGAFALGLCIGFFIGAFAYLFLCCPESLGLYGKRKTSYAWGATLSLIIGTIAWAVAVAMYIL